MFFFIYVVYCQKFHVWKGFLNPFSLLKSVHRLRLLGWIFLFIRDYPFIREVRVCLQAKLSQNTKLPNLMLMYLKDLFNTNLPIFITLSLTKSFDRI